MLAERYDCVLLDLDGVLYRGGEAVPGAREALVALRGARVQLAFLTNNSTRTPEQVAGKLEELGFVANPSEVVTSAIATADLLASRGGGTAFVMGGEGILRALTGAGIRVVDGEPASTDLVVVGLDERLSYAGLRRASLLVRRGARFVATNVDRTYPAEGGEVWPGAGAIVAAVTAATGVEPEVVGKPFAPLFHAALRRAGGGTPLVVGDRLDTDVAGAQALGWDSMLVLTGVSSERDLVDARIRPTYVAEDLGALVRDQAPSRA